MDNGRAAGGHGAPAEEMFDVGVHERMPLNQLLLLGLQNIFGMIGMFVFPGVFGRTFHLSVDQIAYLYGMTFIVSGVVTAGQALLLLRLPIVHGPYVGSFVALLALGQIKDGGGLGLAYGSFFVASIIWALLAVPIRGWSVCGLFARFMNTPLVSGVMVILAMVQVANTSVPNWIGHHDSPGFPLVNLFCGGLAIAAMVSVTLWGGPRLRRVAMLAGLLLGTVIYALFIPISFARVVSSPWLVVPQAFPFGFEVRPDIVLVFVLVLVPASVGSMALYQVVGNWGHEKLTPARMSGGLLSVALGGMLAAAVGSFSTQVYPDNMGLLRSTRVGSRYATLAAGVLLIVLGSCIKFDMLLVLVPTSILSAIATLLFGIVLVHGIHHLARVEWDDRNLIIAGFALLVGLGALFVDAQTQAALPLVVRLLLRQSVVLGGIPLIILHVLLSKDKERAAAGTAAAAKPGAAVAPQHG